MTRKPTYRILIVDDEPSNIQLIRQILKGKYALSIATNGVRALELSQQLQPDIILLDVMMPGIDGYEVCRLLKANQLTANIPVIFVTAKVEIEDESLGFEAGGVDYITKPVSRPIVLARIATHLALFDQHRICKKMVIEQTEELMASQKAAVHMLGEAGHYNDSDTAVHIWRMASYAGAIAKCAGWGAEAVEVLEMAAPMHDTGKIGISDTILRKPGKLTSEEWEIMKTHSTIGYSILSKCGTPLFQMASDIAHYHHEKWDGSGYPDNLAGEDIPESARIVAIADVLDALLMERPYKKAWPLEEALAEINRGSGSHFEPRLIKCFNDVEEDILFLKKMWDNREEEQYSLYEKLLTHSDV